MSLTICMLIYTEKKKTPSQSVVKANDDWTWVSLMILLPHFCDSLMWSRSRVTVPGFLFSVMAPCISIQSWRYTGVSSPQMLPLWLSVRFSSSPHQSSWCVCGLHCLVLSASQGLSPATQRSPSVRARETAPPINPSVTHPPLCSLEKPFSLFHPSLSHQRPHSLESWLW